MAEGLVSQGEGGSPAKGLTRRGRMRSWVTKWLAGPEAAASASMIFGLQALTVRQIWLKVVLWILCVCALGLTRRRSRRLAAQTVSVALPSLIGMSMAEADGVLRAEGYEPEWRDARTRKRLTAPEGQWVVVRQVPRAGFQWSPGHRVIVTVDKA